MAEDSKAVKDILKDLKANDANIVLEAIKRNRKDGNVKTFKALLETLRDTDEPTVEASIIEFLYDLKDEDSIPALVEAINDEEFSYYHSFLVAAFWQSSIDGSGHIDLFVQKAIDGDYMTALEALTVIENFDSSFSQSELLEYETEINEATEKETNEDKKALLISMGDVVRNLPIEGE